MARAVAFVAEPPRAGAVSAIVESPSCTAISADRLGRLPAARHRRCSGLVADAGAAADPPDTLIDAEAGF